MDVKKGFIAEGTTCESCADLIKEQALKVDGVKKVSFDYSTETGYVTFDSKKTNIDEILSKIEEQPYTCYILDENSDGAGTENSTKLFGWAFAIIGIIIAGYFLLNFVEGIGMPTISQNMGYGLLFLVGLLTGFHCIAMCGGFVVGYTAEDAKAGRSSHKSHIMYGTGKTISYTVIGALFGLLGSFIAFTPTLRGTIGLLAGLFLILFGLKMLNIFPILRKVQFKVPKFINRFIGKNSKHSGPFTIGLLNGLMIACGPLQAIYVMAAGTGSPIEGAKLLFIFGIGTLPAMLGFAYFASYISKGATQKLLKASGVIIILLGLIMLNNGLILTGSGYDLGSMSSIVSLGGSQVTKTSVNSDGSPVLTGDGYQEIRMTVDRSGWTPDTFVLKKGVPVRWIIDAKELTGCNNAIQVPKYGLEFDLKKGEQVIEFTPTEAGTVRWSCWMGMIPGSFIVKDDVNFSDKAAIAAEIDEAPKQAAGSCGGSCGSPTCGSAGGGCGGSCGG